MSDGVNDCIFCKIIRGDIPGDFVSENDEFVGFPDINPKAPVHILVVPKAHIRSLNEVAAQDAGFGQRLLVFAGLVAETMGVRDSGYRVVINNGRDAKQVVDHLHLHVLGGTDLGDVP